MSDCRAPDLIDHIVCDLDEAFESAMGRAETDVLRTSYHAQRSPNRKENQIANHITQAIKDLE